MVEFICENCGCRYLVAVILNQDAICPKCDHPQDEPIAEGGE